MRRKKSEGDTDMIKLAIDLGSSMTKIYRADTNNGVVLAEPSCVAVAGEGDEREIKAIGKEAKNLIGKTAEVTNILYPVYEGEIVDVPLAVSMLKEFLARIGVKGSLTRRAQVLFSVPCGIGETTLMAYKALAEECDLKKVWYVEQPYLAAFGAGAVIEGDPIFCLDIGGGVSNAAVVSIDGLVAGISMNVGGNNMDANIITRVSNKYKLLIGTLTAEKIKNEIGTLAPVARGSRVASGRSMETCQPTSVSVEAEDVTEDIRVYIKKVVEYATTVLWKLPAEVAATVHRNGVYLSGGVMQIPAVAQYIGAQLGMRYRVCEEPQYTTVLGGGMLLRERELLNRFAIKER
ncbi:MAG: rod shape-determining protein [Clostridia bacterium]|nr:rod shape-determining protein [Clostridia bacterium]